VLLRVLLIVACDEPWQPEQVVGGATEDEEPVHLGQTSQPYQSEWVGLLQPAEGLFDQPTTAEADRVAGMPGGSCIEVRATPLFILLNMRGDVEGAGSGDEALRVVRLGGAYRHAFCTGLLPFVEHHQVGIALGMSIGLRGHRGGDQTVAVLVQCMNEIRQLRLRIGGLLMGLVRVLCPWKFAPSPSSEPSFLRELSCEAQAWISVPSTAKCSSLIMRFASRLTSTKNRCATSDVDRPRYFCTIRNVRKQSHSARSSAP